MKRVLILAFVGLLWPAWATNAEAEVLGSPRFGSREAEMEYWLRHYLLDRDWLRVAKLESGAQLNSPVAQAAQNYFGLHVAYSRRTTAIGRCGVYAQYSSMAACVRDVAYWAEMSPRRPGEPFDRWLKRRGWNHLPHYYRTLGRVRLPGEARPA